MQHLHTVLRVATVTHAGVSGPVTPATGAAIIPSTRPYGELEKNREAIARFGQGLRPIEAIARALD